MTVQSIKEDILKTYPPKEETKSDWSTFIMSTAYGQIFSSLFDTYNLDEVLENYKQEISTL